MKKTMFKRIFAGIAAVFTLGLCVPTGFTNIITQHSFEAVAKGEARIVRSGRGWTLDEKDVLTVKNNTTIDERKFIYDSSIKKVIIGDHCNIGANAFYGCSALTSVKIGKNCKFIARVGTFPNSAFYSCTSLESVEIGDGCNIGEKAFQECTSLTSVEIGKECDIGDSAFRDCKVLTNVTIGNSCTVNRYAFCSCTSLTNVAIGDSCTIRSLAFNGCNSIQKVFCIGDKNTVKVDNNNPEIICNKDKWLTATKCPKCQGPVIDFKCESCGYFDEAAAQAEIDANEAEIEQKENEIKQKENEIKQKQERNAYLKSLLNEQETQSENESPTTTENSDTASTISTGNPLILLFGGIAVIIGSVAAAIILKRMKKAE